MKRLAYAVLIILSLRLDACGGVVYVIPPPRTAENEEGEQASAPPAQSTTQAQCDSLASQMAIWTALGASGTAAGTAATSVIPALPTGAPVIGTTIAGASLGLFGGIALIVSRVIDNRFSRGCARTP